MNDRTLLGEAKMVQAANTQGETLGDSYEVSTSWKMPSSSEQIELL